MSVYFSGRLRITRLGKNSILQEAFDGLFLDISNKATTKSEY